MSCILYNKGAYDHLEHESRLANSLAATYFGQPLAEFLFELNADAFAIRYGHHSDTSGEIGQARASTESDYEFDLSDWEDPLLLRDLLKRIEYQCADVYDKGEPDADKAARFSLLVAAREDCDRRITHPIYQAEAKRKREAEQTKARVQHDADKERFIKELNEQYPWVKAPNASRNLKKELTLAFPGVKFSVRADHNSMTASWIDGPTTKEVDTIADKYQSGHFDGMIDLYEYDQSAFGSAVSTVLGRAKYISSNRSYSVDFERVCRDIAELQGVPFTSTWQKRDNDTLSLSDYAHRALAKVSFPAGAEYVGVAIGDELRLTGVCSHEDVYKIVTTATDEYADLQNVVRSEFDRIKVLEGDV